MVFAQFYKLSTGYVAGSIPPVYRADAAKPIEACGSDGVLILDGRLSRHRLCHAAQATAEKRGFIGFSLHRGRSFSDSAMDGKPIMFRKEA